MSYLTHYLESARKSTDRLWLESEVHRMALVIASPGADATKDPLVAAALEVMPILVARVNLLEEMGERDAV